MKLRPALGLAASIALAFSLTTPTGAQTQIKATPDGAWDFATETLGAGCTLSGNILTQQMREHYAADHFSVKINQVGDRMDGLFRSYGQAPVIFRKHEDLIS